MSDQEIPDILKKILAVKTREIDERSRRVSIDALRTQAEQQSAPRGFIRAIEEKNASGKSAVIAEIKKASPSKGILRENFDPVAVARSYATGGAACLSVLTDAEFFLGSEDFLIQARQACALPVIRKDFIIDPYQVVEARAIGADCILLIVAALDDQQLQTLNRLAAELALDVLVEVHNQQELDRALELGISLVGINNRDLRSFHVTLDTTIGLLAGIPDNVCVVTESGILTSADVELMRQHQVNAFLVGEAFMRSEDPGTTLKNLFDT